MRARGLTDERSLWQRLPFKKEEKYFFRSPRDANSAIDSPEALRRVRGDEVASA
jgi:hypothetical protein